MPGLQYSKFRYQSIRFTVQAAFPGNKTEPGTRLQQHTVEGGKGYFREPWIAFFISREMAFFSSWNVISVIAVSRDFR